MAGPQNLSLKQQVLLCIRMDMVSDSALHPGIDDPDNHHSHTYSKVHSSPLSESTGVTKAGTCSRYLHAWRRTHPKPRHRPFRPFLTISRTIGLRGLHVENPSR